MRGSDLISGALFSYVDLEQRVPAAHPLRTIRLVVNDVLGSLGYSVRYALREHRSGVDRARAAVARVAAAGILLDPV